MMLSHLQSQYLHLEWADALVWRSVTVSPTAAADPYCLDTFFHIHEAQHAFLNAWTERPFARRKREEFETPAAICAWGNSFHRSVHAYLDTVNESDLSQPKILPWARYFARTLGFEPQDTTLLETLHQLASHSMHHRGQIIRRLRELGETPPTADYIAWVWSKKPDANWPG
ncbi:MAG: DinB family protein [Bacteroidetes bacterium]|nr:DinB family protein [Bacteroidota bacterium]